MSCVGAAFDESRQAYFDAAKDSFGTQQEDMLLDIERFELCWTLR